MPPKQELDQNRETRCRVKYTDHQCQRLEQVFQEQSFIDGSYTKQLSEELGISLKQTRVRNPRVLNTTRHPSKSKFTSDGAR